MNRRSEAKLNKVIRELLNKYGKILVLAIWEIIKPVVMEQIIEGAREFTLWIFKKIRSILVNRTDTLVDTVQFRLEKCRQNASQSNDSDEINVWNAKAEVWQEVYDLMTKYDKKTMKQVDDLEADAINKAGKTFVVNNKQLEEEVAKTIHALPE